MPERIQRKRTAGWRMPKNTLSVCRPGRWGNRYSIGSAPQHIDGRNWLIENGEQAKRFYREWLDWQFSHFPSYRDDIRRELGGKNLACWCKLGEPCHADVLLEVANG